MVATVVTLLLALAGALTGVVVLALLTPVRFALRGVFTEERLDGLADASWCLGAVGVEASLTGGAVVTLFGRTIYRARRGASPKRAASPARGRARTDWRPGPRLVRRVAASLGLRVRVLGRLGTGDPADTAAVYGLVAAARCLFPRVDVSSLRVDWMEPAVDVEGRLDGRLWPAAIAWIVASEYVGSRGSHRAREVIP